MYLNIYFLLFFCYINLLIEKCVSRTVSYINTERPVVTYMNQSCFKSFKIVSRRKGRGDPRHYVTTMMETKIVADNKIKLDIYFYQFLTNIVRYSPNFVELHVRFCDMVDKDPIFGSQLKKNFAKHVLYLRDNNLTDMVIPFVPKNFPFNRGRIYCNVTFDDGNSSATYCARGYIDIGILQMNMTKKKQ